MLPQGISERDFARALEEFRAAVGAEWVFDSDEDMQLYRDAYSPFWGEAEERLASAAVAPSTVEQVQAVMRAANRYRSRGFLTGDPDPVPVVLARSPVAAPPPLAEPAAPESDDLLADAVALPLDEQATASLHEAEAAPPAWPGVGWEAALLEKVPHPALPRAIDQFTEDGSPAKHHAGTAAAEQFAHSLHRDRTPAYVGWTKGETVNLNRLVPVVRPGVLT